MENLYLAATSDSPEVDFRFDSNVLVLKGESYPENAAAFYSGIIKHVQEYLQSLQPGTTVTADVALVYFNSSSTKMLFSLFDALHGAAKNGVNVVLNWRHDPEDDTIEEFGFELRDDFPAIEFHSLPAS